MFSDFISSWALFADAWVSAWLIAALLGLLGVAVLARGQMFLGAAMSQAATAGVALVLALSGAVSAAWIANADAIMAVAGATATALVCMLGRGHREAMPAWIFLASSAASVLLVAHSAHGLDEVNRLLASSLVGATRGDVAMFSALLALTVAVALTWGAQLKTMLLDVPFALAIGIRVTRWEALLAVALGSAVGWSLHVSGLLYTFGCLVLPAMAARELVGEVGAMAKLAPLLALAAAAVATVLANSWDLPPAQVAVAILAGMVMAAKGWRALFHR
jgi:zinc/manganese transport system permease protein